MEKKVLCAASYYNKKYYINPEFIDLPSDIKNELKIISVTISEKIYGIFIIGFYENSDVYFETQGNDGAFDEIGASLEIKRLEKQKTELINALSLWYKLSKTKEGSELKKKFEIR